MRTKPLLTTASAGTFLVLALSTGTAMADPADGSDSPGGAAEAGVVSVSPSGAAPGTSVRVSGTCPTAADGAGDPSVQSVTSDAFTGSESFSKTDPTAFDGTATIAHDAAAGDHTVLLTCSNGTATTTVTVNGGSGTPGPAPSGDGTGSGTGSGAGSGAGSGGDPGALPAPGAGPDAGAAGEMTANAGAGSGDGTSVAIDEGSGSSTPWGWITAGGIIVVGAAAGGTYALTRRRDTGNPSGHTGD